MGDPSLLLCPCLTTAAFHISEGLLWSPGLFLGEEARSGESDLALQGQGLLWCGTVFWAAKAMPRNVPVYEKEKES